MTETNAVVRTFSTGATRDVDHNKLDFEGFLSPLVIDAFAKYMHGKRKLADGSMRDSDNWQKGMPLDVYMKSGCRHMIDWWKHHRGYEDLTVEDLVDTLCATIFNVQGYLHETLKAQREAAAKAPEPAKAKAPAKAPQLAYFKEGDLVRMVDSDNGSYPPYGWTGRVTYVDAKHVYVKWDREFRRSNGNRGTSSILFPWRIAHITSTI